MPESHCQLLALQTLTVATRTVCFKTTFNLYTKHFKTVVMSKRDTDCTSNKTIMSLEEAQTVNYGY